MAAAQYTNIGGVIKQINKKYTNIGGSIKEISKEYTNISGVIRQIFGSTSSSSSSSGSSGGSSSSGSTDTEKTYTNYFVSNSLSFVSGTENTFTLKNNYSVKINCSDITTNGYVYGYLILKITNISAGGDSSTIERSSSQPLYTSDDSTNFTMMASICRDSSVSGAIEFYSGNTVSAQEVPDTNGRTYYYAFKFQSQQGNNAVDGLSFTTFSFKYDGNAPDETVGSLTAQVIGVFLGGSYDDAKNNVDTDI
jgi:hypothetical protein